MTPRAATSCSACIPGSSPFDPTAAGGRLASELCLENAFVAFSKQVVPEIRPGANRFLDVATDRLGDEPRGGGEGAMSMLEGEEGERTDDDYAKGQSVSGEIMQEYSIAHWD